MDFENFAINFKLIYNIVYEIIKNQFTPISVAAHLTYFCPSNLSLLVITQVTILQISFHYNVLSIFFKNMFAKNNCLYI